MYIAVIISLCVRMTTPLAQLCITCQNRRGMSASVPHIRAIMKNSDVVCICEHWLHYNQLSMLDEISIMRVILLKKEVTGYRGVMEGSPLCGESRYLVSHPYWRLSMIDSAA